MELSGVDGEPMELRELVRVHPKRCGGQPTVMDFRLPVRIIYDLVDAEYSPEEIAWLYPYLRPDLVKELIFHRGEVEALILEHGGARDR